MFWQSNCKITRVVRYTLNPYRAYNVLSFIVIALSSIMFDSGAIYQQWFICGSTIFLYPVCSHCLQCTLFDIMACRQTLHVQFSRPKSSINCHTWHVSPACWRLTSTAVRDYLWKIYLGGRQLSVSTRPQLQRWALSVQRLTTNRISRLSHSTRLIFIISCHQARQRRHTLLIKTRAHDYTLSQFEQTSLSDNNYINRMLFKNIGCI